jgi:hypothetical protein
MLDYEVRVVDDAIPEDVRQLVWEYLLQSTWSVAWKRYTGHNFHEIHEYKPGLWKNLEYPKRLDEPRHLFMPRAHFASDDESLKKHEPIYKLWQCINMTFDGEFEIAGKPEGTVPENSPDEKIKEKYTAPPTQDPSLEQGWRVYSAAQPNEHIKRTHGIHRDQPDESIDNTYTCLYVANPEWYPSWFADNMFYTSGHSETGDDQRFQKGGQRRGFQVDWGDDCKVVSPKPGRLICYDSRRLHTTRPAAIWAEADRKVVTFRLRKK